MQSDRPERFAQTASARHHVTGIVLCGGASRRMGSDKASIELDGRTLLERAIAALEPLAGQTVLACGSQPRYADLERPLALDRIPDGGPLAGLAAGLELGGTEWAVAVACDMPRLDPGFLGTLLAHAIERDVDVCLPSGPRGLEPLCAVYRRTCLEPIRAALEAGERRMVSFWSGAFAERRPALRVATLELASAGSDPMINLNSPEDLDEERRHLAARPS